MAVSRFSPKPKSDQENPSYLALWAILTAKELFNASVLGFLLNVEMFSDFLGSLFGVYLILVIVSLLGVILNILGDYHDIYIDVFFLGLLINRDMSRIPADLEQQESLHLVNIYKSVFEEDII